MTLRSSAAIMAAVCTAALGQTGTSVDAVVALVRPAVRSGQPDKQIAKGLHGFKLTERLEDAVIDELESIGAGPATVAELGRLRDASRKHPLPASPPVVFEAPPKPPDAEQARVWESARDASLEYTRSLPDFICTQAIQRFADPGGKGDWKRTDTLMVRLTYFGQSEKYQLISVNDRPAAGPYEQVGGAISKGEFGSMLHHIFNPRSETAWQWDHWTMLRRRLTHVYFFRVTLFNSSYMLQFATHFGEGDAIKVGQHGYVYVDRDSNRVVRMVSEADSIPPRFPVQKAVVKLDYDFADVGGRQYLLPLHAEVLMGTGPLAHKNEVEFRLYRKFASESSISFDPEPP